MRTQGYKLEGLEQANEVLTSLNSKVMAQLEQMTVTMNAMKAKLKNTHICTNQPSEAKKKFLLLGLREHFHSWEKNLLSKESGTSRGSVLQEKDKGQ